MFGYLSKVALVVCFLLLSACGGSELYSELEEHQVNEMQALLINVGIPAEKKLSSDGKAWRLLVPKAYIPESMTLLSEHGLPRQTLPSIADVFKKEGFVSSPVEEHARYVYAISQELSNTIMQLDGVASARVHAALPARAALEKKQQSASVSVVIIEKPGFDLSKFETDIKAIATDGIEGLSDINRVTVKFFPREARAVVIPKQSLFMDQTLLLGGGVALCLALLIGIGASVFFQRRKTTLRTAS
ncbi:Type III secretion pathway protein [gamma proteobacterium HdN1]|nr:Type III secretion pathway protein [gamma proteobacterium HdN1]